jgi:peptide/nickel transport system permease protein
MAVDDDPVPAETPESTGSTESSGSAATPETEASSETPEPSDARVQLADELARVGLARRMFAARRWYGADWWFVAISVVMVAGFITLALFPGLIAPHPPDEQVGPRFLAPGEVPDVPVLIVTADSTAESLESLAVGPDAEVSRPPIGVVRGVPTATALRERASAIDDELQAGDSELRLRPDIERFDTVDETLDALSADEVEAAVIQSTEFSAAEDAYPGLVAVSPLDGDTASAGGFVFGTNQIGQDVLSRLIWGTRIALIIGFASAGIALVLGVPLGLIAGYLGGRTDRILTVIMDSLYAFPGLILAIAITAVLGPSVFNVIIAIAVLYVPTYYRIVRGQTLAAKEDLYVEAARSIGATSAVVLRRYIYPNVIPSVAIIFSVNIADAILTGAGLSFLGLGLPPSTADWGIDIARGQQFIRTAWWLTTFPGMAIMLIVLSFTMMGEGLMEIFNPKLRER